MVTLRDSLLSSSARMLPIRRRPDLVARRQHYLGRSYWVVKDPVGLNYFRFQEEEYAILQMLDGQTSLDEIKDRFEADFPPQKITLEELQQFLGMLHRSGLVVTDLPGQGRQLRQRRDERVRKQWLSAVSNILCIRFKGFDPERLLNWLYPYFRWFFSPITLALCCLLGLSALLLVAVEFDVFHSKLPEFYQFFNVHNAFLLALVLGVTKVMHEFGHGLACKHFGGECHEMGIMVLVLTPCLYCNVSDSWMLPNKWHRAGIGAAGIYVEVVLASICTFLWWFSEPGLFHNLCLNVMFVCSTSTIIFNANPLLRYDGYYVLADLVEIPNLRQKATTILSRKLGEWCLGLEPPDDPFLPQRNQVFFALYSIAAAAYRWVVAFSICWFLYKLFQSYDLKIVGQCVVLASLWGLLVLPLYQVAKFFYVPGRLEQVKKPRFYASLGVLVAAAAGGAVSAAAAQRGLHAGNPGPRRSARLCRRDRQAAVARRDAWPTGRRRAATRPTQQHRHRSGNRQARGQRRRVSRAVGGPAAAGGPRSPRRRTRFPQIQEALKTVEDQLQEKTRDKQRLRLAAPLAGTVLPPTITTAARRRRREAAGLVRHAAGPGERRRYTGAGRAILPDRRSEATRGRHGHRSGRPEYGPRGPGRRHQTRGLPLDHAAQPDYGDRRIGIEGQPAAAVEQVGRRTGHQDRSAHGRREAHEHLLPGPRADRRSRRGCFAWAFAAKPASTPIGCRWARGCGGC